MTKEKALELNSILISSIEFFENEKEEIEATAAAAAAAESLFE